MGPPLARKNVIRQGFSRVSSDHARRDDGTSKPKVLGEWLLCFGKMAKIGEASGP